MAWVAGVVQAQTSEPVSRIAQEPLIVKDPGVVEPNLMFTLDDSASMAYNFLPDNELADAIFAFHPAEPHGEWRKYYVHYTQGVLATNDSNVLGMRRRAPKVNTLYYNPEVQYLPWVDENGKPMPDADPKAAYFHLNYAGRGDPASAYNQRGNRLIRELRVDLTGTVRLTTLPACREGTPNPLATDVPCPPDPDVKEIMPATWYEFTWPGMNDTPPKKASEADKNNPGNYKRVSIADPARTTFIHGPDRKDCTAAGDGKRSCTREQEYRNFANWYQYHRTRMHVAIASVGQAFAALPEHLRVGYGRINKLTASEVDGQAHEVVVQGVRSFRGDERRKFLRWLNGNIGLGSTPLVNAIEEVGKYFKRADDQGPWSESPGVRASGGKGSGNGQHLSCRRSYHVLMTDGMYNFHSSVGQYKENYQLESDSLPGRRIDGADGQSYTYRPERPYASGASGTLADYAMDLWKNDLRTDLVNDVQTDAENPAFWQHVSTYTLSFGVSGDLDPDRDLDAIRSGAKSWPDPVWEGHSHTIDDLWHAAVNSRGKYVNVQEGAGFYSHIQQILNSITGRIGNAGGVAVESPSLQANNVKYVPSYTTRDWIGELQAFRLDNGTQKEKLWSASEQVPPALSRNWFVGVGADPDSAGVKSVMFFWDRIPDAMRKTMLDAAGLTATPNRGSPMMAWLRGDQSNEGSLFRRRRGLLGHIVNSPPVYVGAPIDHGYRFLPARFPNGVESGAGSYRAHVVAKQAGASRPGLIFVGGNEGVLHAFDAATGTEVYGFTPNAVVSEMARSSRMDYKARYLVDGPLVERDGYWDGKWQNVLLGTTGAGPRSVFALNVLDTRHDRLGASTLMWELDARTQPEIGHVLSAPEVGVLRDGTWVAVFGNGYESLGGRAQLFVVELKTGKVLARIDTRVGSATDPNGLGGVTLVKDGTQVITAAYAGDLKGNVWKFDLASADRNGWKVGLGGQPLYTTGRPVTAAPATVVRPDGGVMVLVGTGKLFEVGDQQSTAGESLYGLWDNDRLTDDGKGNPAWSGGGTITADKVRKNRSSLTRGGDFVEITPDGRSIDWTRDRGWQVELTMLPQAASAQRLIAKPLMLSGLALFETMSPALSMNHAENACKTALLAPAFSLLLDPLTGLMAPKATIDTNRNDQLDGGDSAVGGWRVEDWKGRSVVLTASPPAPCTALPCTQAAPPARFCPKGYLLNMAINVGGSTPACVQMPPDERWWWRELDPMDRAR